MIALDEQLRQGIETHLYLTDYRSLYVGLLAEVTADAVPHDTPAELDHMPGYLATPGLKTGLGTEWATTGPSPCTLALYPVVNRRIDVVSPGQTPGLVDPCTPSSWTSGSTRSAHR